MTERFFSTPSGPDEVHFDRLFRPTSFDEYVGQERHVANLRVFVEAARRRGEPLDHLLLCGPPGLGKTTLAHVVARAMAVALHSTSGPAIEHKGALAGLLTKVELGEVLFIDEIHRLGPAVEESLYPAIETFQIDLMTGDGPHATTIRLPLRPFCLIGATTRTGLLTAPLLSRFGHVIRLDFYPVEELVRIVERSARLLGAPIDAAGALEIARRSRGTPRVANRLLRRVRDFADVRGSGRIDAAIVRTTAEALEIDAAGLDAMDRRLLGIIIDDYDGGPVGIETLSAALSEPRGTLEDVYEPYLLQQGSLGRTPRGRIATRRAHEHLGRPYRQAEQATPEDEQGELF
ncbi:MAG: Holliday junction branch migration DNA helicase RuvB [Deltaproteobacteria bacterium]|nr:Holliday junction branch migration DNA helicase RuvB [Deltaproteobacteria bacterium]